jgi:hypothetical protein
MTCDIFIRLENTPLHETHGLIMTIIDRPFKEKIGVFDRFLLNFWRAASVQTVESMAGYSEDPSPAHDRTDSDTLHAAYLRIDRLSKSCTSLTSEKKSLVMVDPKLNRTVQSYQKYG